MTYINNLLSHLFQTTLVMSGIGLCFLGFRAVLSRHYDTAWRRSAWLIIFTGFLFLYKPHITSGYLAEQYYYPLSAAAAPRSAAGFSLQTTLFSLWLLVACMQLVLLFFRHQRFMSRVRRLARVEKEEMICAQLAVFRREFGLKSNISLYRVAGLSTPMLVGYFRPVILLPETDLDPEALTFIIRHELVHYQQHDLWWKSYIEIICALHWFNPCMYLFRHYFAIDMENACDAVVIAQESEEARAHYCQTILTVIRLQGRPETAFSTHFGASADAIRKRLQEILHFRHRRPCVWLAVLLGTVTLLSASIYAFHLEGTPVYAGNVDFTSYVETEGLWDALTQEVYPLSGTDYSHWDELPSATKIDSEFATE